MKVAIVELSPKAHVTLVETLIKIFLSSPGVTLKVFTTQLVAQELLSYTHLNQNIEFYILKEEESILGILNQINAFFPDRIYIVTLENYFKYFSRFNFGAPIHLFVHNILDWMETGWGFRFNNFLSDPQLFKNLRYKLKFCFIYPSFRKKILKNVIKSNGKVTVLNAHMKDVVSRYLSREFIEVIPFSIFDPELVNSKRLGVRNGNKLRICIPGIVTSHRRDYIGFLTALEQQSEPLLNHVIVDLLGGISYSEDGMKILTLAKKLCERGYQIVYHEKNYISMAEYDEALMGSDIILGNMNIILDRNNIYGKTKDSGIIYNMIKAAKPGILPFGYPIIPELQTSSLVYNDYEELFKILIKLIYAPDFLNNLRIQARINSLNFTADSIYKSII